MNIGLIQPLNEKKYLYAIFASILAVVLLMASIGPSLLAAATDDDDDDGVVSFELATRFGSGIEAHIILVDTGTENVYVGVATGMIPGEFYVSLIYDVLSPVDGPSACAPGIDPNSGAPGALTDPDQMFIGFWVPVDAPVGTPRTLEMHALTSMGPPPVFGPEQTVKTGAQYTPIGDIGTMSIRQAPDFNVVACGELDDDRDLDSDEDSDSDSS